jgi:hypothetical protein
MLRNTLAVLLMFYLATSSHASIIISTLYAPTTGLPGYITETLTATDTDATEKIIGFDFASGSSGFFGAMNQVNPFGISTVFNDNNAFFPVVGATPDQDSQFQVNSGSGIFVIPAETANKLQAAFNYSAANIAALASNVWPFVHIAHRVNSYYNYSGTFTIRDAQGRNRLESVSGVPCLCGISVSYGDIKNVNANVPGFVDYTFTAFADLPQTGALTWSNFGFNYFIPPGSSSGSSEFVGQPASFDPTTQKFHWNTIGATLGTYAWSVSASAQGYAGYGQVLVHITSVPEPATMTLLGSTIIATCGGFIRRRRLA